MNWIFVAQAVVLAVGTLLEALNEKDDDDDKK